MMRNKRVDRFRKSRHQKARRLVLFTFVMPAVLALIGYLLASLVILPSMHH